MMSLRYHEQIGAHLIDEPIVIVDSDGLEIWARSLTAQLAQRTRDGADRTYLMLDASKLEIAPAMSMAYGAAVKPLVERYLLAIFHYGQPSNLYTKVAILTSAAKNGYNANPCRTLSQAVEALRKHRADLSAREELRAEQSPAAPTPTPRPTPRPN